MRRQRCHGSRKFASAEFANPAAGAWPTVATGCARKGNVMSKAMHALAGAMLTLGLIVAFIALPVRHSRTASWAALGGALAAVGLAVLAWT